MGIFPGRKENGCGEYRLCMFAPHAQKKTWVAREEKAIGAERRKRFSSGSKSRS